MSWIFHEPLEPAVYARRTVGPPLPPAAQVFSSQGRIVANLVAGDIFLDNVGTSQRRPFAPPAVATPVASFSGTARFHGIDLFADEPWIVRRPGRFAPLAAVADGDVGRSASFTLTFTGQAIAIGSPTGLYADPSQGLSAQPLAILEVALAPAGVTFTGVSAARIV